MLKRQLQKSNPGEQMGAKSISNDKMSKSNYSELNNSKSKSPESVYMLVHLLGIPAAPNDGDPQTLLPTLREAAPPGH